MPMTELPPSWTRSPYRPSDQRATRRSGHSARSAWSGQRRSTWLRIASQHISGTTRRSQTTQRGYSRGPDQPVKLLPTQVDAAARVPACEVPVIRTQYGHHCSVDAEVWTREMVRQGSRRQMAPPGL